MTVKCAAGTEGGPGSEPQFRTTLWLFFARVLLCWVALAFLPFSRVKGGYHYRPVRGELASVTRKGGRVDFCSSLSCSPAAESTAMRPLRIA